MAFTRDFTGVGSGVLKIDGPIQIAQGTASSGAGSYVPAKGELFYYTDASSKVKLVCGDGTTTVANLPALLTASYLEAYTGIDSGKLYDDA